MPLAISALISLLKLNSNKYCSTLCILCLKLVLALWEKSQCNQGVFIEIVLESLVSVSLMAQHLLVAVLQTFEKHCMVSQETHKLFSGPLN